MKGVRRPQLGRDYLGSLHGAAVDSEARAAQVQQLLDEVNGMLARLGAHEAVLLGHHDSRERTHALRQAKGAIRRHDKLRRRLERALRVQA